MKTDEQLIANARKFIVSVANNINDEEEDRLMWEVLLLGGRFSNHQRNVQETRGIKPWVLSSIPTSHNSEAIPAMVRRMNALIGLPDFVPSNPPATTHSLEDEAKVFRHCGREAYRYTMEWEKTAEWDKVIARAKEVELQKVFDAFYKSSWEEYDQERRLTALIDYCQTGDVDYVINYPLGE